MEQKMHKRILSFIEEERLLSGDERICVDIFRRLKKNRSYLPSLHAVVELAKSFNCSADFLLGLSDFPDSADENIDVNSFCKNLNRFAKLHPTKFYLLKKQGFCKEFSSFYKTTKQYPFLFSRNICYTVTRMICLKCLLLHTF